VSGKTLAFQILKVAKMIAINNNKTSDINLKSNFDILCQDFDGGGFYGLEYILEDFFQSDKIMPSSLASVSIDWFGLNS
jgi:hypothetical protein